MSTRSYIAMKTPAGYKAIFCHWDGYPDHVGKILKEHYNTLEKATELINLGDLECLYETIGKKHDGRVRCYEQKTTAAYRDLDYRWEEVKPKMFSTFAQLKSVAKNSWAEFLYVYYPEKNKEVEKIPNYKKNYWMKEDDYDSGGWKTTPL